MAKASVIGIDFGTEFYKAVLVKPGAPFSIIENTSSKRKTENGVCFTDEERAFESDSIAQSASYPSLAFLRTLELLGQEFPEDDSSIHDRFKYTHLNDLVRDERGNIGYEVTIPDDNDFVNIQMFTEEIIGMILQHARKLAKNQNEGTVTDVTITVPSYFTMNQRQMMLDASNLAGFNVLTLLHENTAAALMYGIDTKNLEYPHKVLLVNMGASDLELSVVNLDKIYKNDKDKKGTLSVEILEEASAPGVGGLAFDLEFVKIIAERFDSKPERSGKPSILDNNKLVRRLMKDVPKYKEILSANREVQIRIIELTDNIGLDFTLKRSEFENRINHIVEQARPAFQKILEHHSVDELKDVEILGGGLRVPKVKELISALLGGKTLSTHMNPDEAMAFGSAYIAANFSSNYQVQKVYLYQKVPDTVYLNLTQIGGCKSEDTEECFTKHMMLYNAEKDNLGAKKTITISNHLVDMDASLYTLNPDGSEHVLATHKIRNIEIATTAAVNAKDTVIDRKISISFKYDKSGILSIKKAEAYIIEEIEVKTKPKKADNDTSTDDSEAKISFKEKTHTYTLRTTEKLVGAKPLNTAQKNKAKKRLNDLEKRDRLQEKIKVAQNEYESLIYSSRSYVEDEDNALYFKDQNEKDKLILFIDEEEDWIYMDHNVDYETYRNKFKVLDKKIKPIRKRKSLRDTLPDEIDSNKKELDRIVKAMAKYKRRNSWIDAQEFADFDALVTETREYLDSKQEVLDNIPLNEQVPFTVTNLNSQVTRVNDLMRDIKRIKKPKAPQPDVESHGEVSEKPGSYRIDNFDSSKDNIDDLNDFIKIDNSNIKKKKVKPDDVIVEDVELGFRDGKISSDMQAQIDQMMKGRQLKDDLIEGKIEYNDLTPEEIEAIHKA